MYKQMQIYRWLRLSRKNAYLEEKSGPCLNMKRGTEVPRSIPENPLDFEIISRLYSQKVVEMAFECTPYQLFVYC